MKKYILLLASLTIGTAQAKELNPTTSWKTRYGIKQLSSSDKNALATGLYNLMKEKGNETTTPLSVSQFHKIANGTCHYTCKNAFQRVFDKTVSAAHNHNQKASVWVDSVKPYYTDVVKQLKQDEMTISFGSDCGKKLPTTEIEIDRMLNPKPTVTTVFHVHTPGFYMHVQI